MCIINEDKWKTLENRDTLLDLCGTIDGLEITDVVVKNPDNPAKLRNAKLIIFTK